MLKFFRNLRKKLLSENQLSKYLLYALGEIILVVFGILIALQINNWNQDRINLSAEKRYVQDLIQDFKNDAKMLAEINAFLALKAKSKTLITPLLEGQDLEIDSLEIHFARQWGVFNRFTPTTITIDELKNSGNLNILRDVQLRRDIVALYNSYSNEAFSEDMFNAGNLRLVGLAGEHFRNVLKPQPEEIYEALEDNNFVNGIIVNFTFARKNAINELQGLCSHMISKLEEYSHQIRS